jgi:hypothetical protein
MEKVRASYLSPSLETSARTHEENCHATVH